jgi:hypothetical protein
MQPYQTKITKIRGTNYREVHRRTLRFYNIIKKRSRRRPYVRSKYFNKKKVFLELFWKHVYEKKNFGDRMRRMKYFLCAIDLIQRSYLPASIKENPNKPSEILYRFTGITHDNEKFFVQIKENTNTRQKWLMSIFPNEKIKKTLR